MSEPVMVYEARMAHAMATDASRAHSMRYTHSSDVIAVSMPISDGRLPLSSLLRRSCDRTRDGMSGRRVSVCQNLSWCTKHEWRTRWQLMRVELTACATLTGSTTRQHAISDGSAEHAAEGPATAHT